jgi:hypothetical protein
MKFFLPLKNQLSDAEVLIIFLLKIYTCKDCA